MFLRSLFISLFISAGVRAQIGSGVVLRGQIESEDGRSLNRVYIVDISECGGVASLGRAALPPDNRFEFRDLKTGCKKVRVLSSDERDVIYEDRVFVTGDASPMIIRLPGEKPDAPPGSPTVSADLLRHPIPAKVLHNVVEAEKLSGAGKNQEAAEKLRGILEHYPNIWQAQLNLGVLEMRLGHTQEALERFLKAREFQPGSAIAIANAAVASLMLNRAREADQLAREALAVDPKNNTAQLLLNRAHQPNASQ